MATVEVAMATVEVAVAAVEAAMATVEVVMVAEATVVEKVVDMAVAMVGAGMEEAKAAAAKAAAKAAARAAAALAADLVVAARAAAVTAVAGRAAIWFVRCSQCNLCQCSRVNIPPRVRHHHSSRHCSGRWYFRCPCRSCNHRSTMAARVEARVEAVMAATDLYMPNKLQL